MRRFEVYFLQKKVDGVWQTLERSQSASLLVASLVREFESREDAELRILAGAYDEPQEAWEYTQIFFVDRGSIELGLAETPGSGDATEGPEAADDDAWPVAEWRRPTPAGTMDGGDTVPGGRGFADAIRRASEETEATEAEPSVEELWRARRNRLYDEKAAGPLPVGPPPRLDERRARSGRSFFIVGTVLIALILTAAAVLALGIALDLPQVRPLLALIQGADGPAGPDSAAADKVMPKTTGKVVTYAGVAPGLRGRWSPGRCDQTYIEFDADGLVVGTPGGQQSLKVPVVETLEDDYSWYVRRSPDLVEHFQKLGPTDLQLVGDTTRVGFSARSSDILTRCP